MQRFHPHIGLRTIKTGIPSDKNQAHMERLGIAVPAEFRHKCNETTMFVANYHLDKLWMAYEILQDYLVEDAKAQPTPKRCSNIEMR